MGLLEDQEADTMTKSKAKHHKVTWYILHCSYSVCNAALCQMQSALTDCGQFWSMSSLNQLRLQMVHSGITELMDSHWHWNQSDLTHSLSLYHSPSYQRSLITTHILLHTHIQVQFQNHSLSNLKIIEISHMQGDIQHIMLILLLSCRLIANMTQIIQDIQIVVHMFTLL